MVILFADHKLEQLCNTERTGRKKLGAGGARKLFSRLADLHAAATVDDLVAGRPHPLKGDRLGQFAVDLDGGRRRVFECANEPVPQHADGAIDWSRVTTVRIVYIGDYHG